MIEFAILDLRFLIEICVKIKLVYANQRIKVY